LRLAANRKTLRRKNLRQTYKAVSPIVSEQVDPKMAA